MYLNIVCCCIICLLVLCVGPGLIVLFFYFLVKKKELVALLYKCDRVTVCVPCLFLAGAKSWSVIVIFPGIYVIVCNFDSRDHLVTCSLPAL